MENKKYIKVSTADRPPETITKIITLRDCKLESSMLSESGNWYSFESESEIETPEYWLDEKPDYEEEMREVLERLTGHYEDVLKGDFSKFSLRSEIDSAKELLTKINQQS